MGRELHEEGSPSWIKVKLTDAPYEKVKELEKLYDLRNKTKGDRAKIIDAVVGLSASIPLHADIVKDIKLTLGLR